MPIHPPDSVPNAGFEIIRRHLSGEQPQQPPLAAFQPGLEGGALVPVNFVRAANLLNEERAAVVPISKPLKSTEPYGIYVATRDDIDEGLLQSARLAAWHYVLVEENDHVHSLVEVAALGKNQEALSYTALRPREYADMMVTAIDRANALVKAPAPDYELRVLRASDLSLLAVWLHTDEEGEDLIIPILTSKPDFEAGTVMTEGQLIKVLGVIAKRRRQASDRFPEKNAAEATLPGTAPTD